MAKELCMLENNPMGKLARQYFIWREEQAKKLLAEKDSNNVGNRLESAMVSWIEGLKGFQQTVDSGFFQTTKKIDEIDQKVVKIDQKVVKIESDVSELNRKVEQVTKRIRKDFPKDIIKLHTEVVFTQFNGKCPCCNQIVVAESMSKITPTAQKDHIDNDFVNTSKYRTWIICSNCNKKKESKYDFAVVKTVFDAYQVRLKQYEEKKNAKRDISLFDVFQKDKN